MAAHRFPEPALLVVATFSRHDEAFTWAEERLESVFGPIGLKSVPFDFIQTSYYESTMGSGLLKQFFVHANLVAPESLADCKLRTNELEHELAQSGRYAEPRPLNLDPGHLS